MEYYLGIDMGTSSIKANVIDENGLIVSKARTSVSLINPQEGFFEIDPEKTWWEGFREITRQISSDVDISQIASICISSLCGTFVPVDEDLRPLCNAILYSIDTRSKEQVRRLNEKFGEERLVKDLGGVFTTHSIFPKILWLKENCPEVYAKAKYFVESNNYVSMMLTGKTAWDYPSAIGSQMVDINNLSVASHIMAEAGLDREKIPRLNYVTDVLGEVSTERALDLGYRKGTPVMTGGCDINAEAMSIGAVNPGDMLVVFGSTMSTLMTLSSFQTMKGFRIGMSVKKGTYRLGTASSAGARHLQWVDRMLGVQCNIDRKALPTGIMMLPYLDGMRSPFDDPNAKPAFLNLEAHTTANDLSVSAREALGYEIAMLLDMVESKGQEVKVMNCTGGLTNIRELMQIVSDITGKKLRLFRSTDASFGDAFIALSKGRDFESFYSLEGIQKEFSPDEVVEPDEEMHEKYQPLSKKYNGAYEKLRSLF